MSVNVSGIADVVIAGDVDYAISPRCVGTQHFYRATFHDVFFNSRSTFEHPLPVPATTFFKLCVVNPLTPNKIAKHSHMCRRQPPVQCAIDVSQVEVVTEKIEPLS